MTRRILPVAASSHRPQLVWIVLAAAVGASGAWGLLTLSTPRAAPVAVEGLPAAQRTDAPAAPAWAGTPRAAAAASPPPAAPAGDAALDDAALVRLAQDEFGFDCPGIAERGPEAPGGFEFTCTNGELLRLYAMAGARPRVGARH